MDRASQNNVKNRASALPQPDLCWALFLDVDGTLIELVPDPETVEASPALVAMIAGLHRRLGGACALVSGRPIATLDSIFAPLRLPAGGNHGLERRGADGVIHRPEPDAALDAVRRAFASFRTGHPGTRVEDKTLSVALHYREAPDAADAAAALAERLAADLDAGLVVQYGKMMVEVRPGSSDKGAVISALMKDPPFAGRRPVFVGDDITDEHGFSVVNALGGYSVRVGNGADSVAGYRVADVAGVIEWLAPFAEGAAENGGKNGRNEQS